MSRSDNQKTLAVVHYFMHKSKEDSRNDFSNKKLQKLLYYAQAWNLVLNDKRLINKKFEAWIHGAAIPVIYGRYKKFGFDEITEEYDEDEFSIFSNEEKQVLDEVWRIYGKYDADYLELLNHSENPWQNARESLSPFEPSSAEISEKDMSKYYGEKLEKATKA